MEPNTVSHSVVWRPTRWMVAGEAVLFAMAVPVAAGGYWLAAGERYAALTGELLAGAAFGAVMVMVLHALGMHALRVRQNGWQNGLKYLAGMGIAGTMLWVLLDARPDVDAVPVRVAIAVLMSFSAVLVWRYLFQAAIDSNATRHRVVIFGAGRKAGNFNESMRRRSDRRGIDIVGYLPLDGDERHAIAPNREIHMRRDIERFCKRHRIDEIVIASDDHLKDLPMTQLVDCRFHGVLVTDAASFIERECYKIPVDMVEPEWWLDRGGFSESMLQRRLKRVFDLVTGSILLLAAAPLMLMCAAAVKLEDGWRAPVLFCQKRTGLDGRIFEVLKFRSMREDAEKDGVARWAARDDDRVTRVGAFMRKTRLDELPQLINVLRGDMSLVGPRPERPEFVQRLSREIPYYNHRHCMQPGITGWAQLCYPYGASVKDAREKLKFDLYYIKNHSLLFDLAIILRTAEVVLFGKGAR